MAGLVTRNTATVVLENYDNLMYDDLWVELRKFSYQEPALILLNEMWKTKRNPLTEIT